MAADAFPLMLSYIICCRPNVQQKMGDISIAGNKILPGIAFGLLIVVIIIAYRRKKPGYMSIDQNMDNRINEATESSSLQN